MRLWSLILICLMTPVAAQEAWTEWRTVPAGYLTTICSLSFVHSSEQWTPDTDCRKYLPDYCPTNGFISDVRDGFVSDEIIVACEEWLAEDREGQQEQAEVLRELWDILLEERPVE